MKLIGEKKDLYIEHSDVVTAGIDPNTALSGKARGSKSWITIKDPDDLRKNLYHWESMTTATKKIITDHFGNPYEFVVNEPLKKLVTTDYKAQDFFIDYRYGPDNDKSLPTDPYNYIQKYTEAASWLNMIIRIHKDKAFIKTELKLNKASFWDAIAKVIKTDKIELPATFKGLMQKIDEYKKKEVGYKCIIDWRFGNTNRVYVNDEVSLALLLDMFKDDRQFDDVYITWRYNEWARANSRKTICDQTAGNYRRKYAHEIDTERYGRAAFNDKYIIQVPRERPSTPLYQLNHDDNHLDLYFIDFDNKDNKFYNKYKAIVIIDSFNDLVVGYAYALNLSNDLIRQAYLNAMYYIKSLTGGWYIPHEIKSDRWGSKELKPFYQSMGHYHDTPVGSKGSGYIEQCFSRNFFKNCMKITANKNYSGNNITAKNAGVNREVLDMNKNLRPTVGDAAAQQIEEFFYLLRNMPTKDGALSKKEEWLRAWDVTADDKKKPISEETFLMIFGKVSNSVKPITITNRGVEPEIGNVEYRYQLPYEIINKYIGMKVRVLYDPLNMDRVLLTNFKDFRCVATVPNYVPSALADYKEGSRTNLNKILDLKLKQVEYSATRSTKRKAVLIENGIDTEAILQAGVVIPKLLKQKAEELSAAGFTSQKEMASQHQEYLEQKTDFDKYLTD